MGLLDWIKKAPGELMPGVEKPTTIVAKALVAEMLVNIPKGLYEYSMSAQFPSFKVTIERKDKNPTDYKKGNHPCVVSVTIPDHPNIRFDEAEMEIFSKGIRTAISLAKQQAEADKEAQSQNAAINFLANKLGVNTAEISAS